MTLIVPALQKRPDLCLIALFVAFGLAGGIAPTEDPKTWPIETGPSNANAPTPSKSASETATGCVNAPPANASSKPKKLRV